MASLAPRIVKQSSMGWVASPRPHPTAVVRFRDDRKGTAGGSSTATKPARGPKSEPEDVFSSLAIQSYDDAVLAGTRPVVKKPILAKIVGSKCDPSDHLSAIACAAYADAAPPTAVVAGLYDAFKEGNMQVIMDATHPDFVMSSNLTTPPFKGGCKGPCGLVDYLRTVYDTFEITQFDPKIFQEGPTTVRVDITWTGTARRTGRSMTTRIRHLLELSPEHALVAEDETVDADAFAKLLAA